MCIITVFFNILKYKVRILLNKHKLNWTEIDTVFLDMDGTLLDLYFDNYFWLNHVPQRYAEKHNIDKQQALQKLLPKFKAMEGTIDWYCIDYWSKELELDIALLKQEIKHLIQIHPFVLEFLQQLKEVGKQRVLVTNAHQKSLALKMEQTSLAGFLDTIISAHQLGLPKEDAKFWLQLSQIHDYDPHRTLLIDDNLLALESASKYGIKYLLAIGKPDSRAKSKPVGSFQAIHSFQDLFLPD